MKEGHKLLKLFRAEQKKKGNIGCMCGDCIQDMDDALKEYNKLTKVI